MPDCEKNEKCAALELLEQRVDNLEDGQKREESFRKTYYADREDRIRRDAELDAKINCIDSNVSKLVKRQEEEDKKPRTFLDTIKANSAWLIISFILGGTLNSVCNAIIAAIKG